MATRTADAHRHVHGESVQRLFHEKTRPPRSVPQQFREKLAQHTPTNTTPGTKLSPHTPTNTTPGTKLAPHTPTNTTPGTKLSPHTPTRHKTLPALQKTPDLGTFPRAGRIYSRMWVEQAEQGEYIHACGSNRPSRANVFTHVDRTGRAGRMYSRMRIKQAKRKNFAYELSHL